MFALLNAIMADKKQTRTTTGLDGFLDENIGIYERDGIKFMYMPLITKSSVEGSPNSTHLKAVKGIDSYTVEFKSDQLGQIIPFAAGDVDMFNKIIIKYLSGRLDCKNQTKVTDEFILITIQLEVFEKEYEIKIKLTKERIDEQQMIKRKLAYLVEKVTWYENTINHYFRPMKDMKYVNGKWEKLELPSYSANCIDYSSKIYKQFIESKTEGYFAEISNWNLHNILLRQFPKYAEDFKTYDQNVKQNPANEKTTQHPLSMLHYYGWEDYIRVMLLILNHAGYELMDNIAIATNNIFGPDGVADRKTVIVKIAKTNVNYRYEFTSYQNMTISIRDYNVYYMIHDTNCIIQIKKIKV